MRGTRNRLVALILALAMSLSLLQTSVWAAEVIPEEPVIETVEEIEETPAEEVPEEAEEAPAEEVPEEAEEAPAEEAPEEAPAETPVEEAPVEEAPEADIEVIQTKTFEQFAICTAQLVKDNPVNYKKATSTYALKRLIVQTDGTALDFAAYSPEAVIISNDNCYVLQFATKADTKAACTAIKKLSGVVYAEPDRVRKLVGMSTANGSATEPAVKADTVTPTDIITPDEVTADTEHLSWGVSRLGIDDYAEYVAGKTSDSITVAVVDTGVDSTHPWLKGRVKKNGYDFIDNDKDPYDENEHGTHVSGTIVDCTPGLNVKILPVRVLDADGYGDDLSIANGIRYAVDKGAKVINLSLGGPHESNYMENALKYAVKNGVVPCIAAGNEMDDVATSCPAHSDINGLLCVAAVNYLEEQSWFSNYGAEIDVCAPGEDILSSIPEGRYMFFDGTSMATPHIAAIVAMIRLANPAKTPAGVETMVKSYCRDLGSKGWDKKYGCGFPDMAKAARSKLKVNSITVSRILKTSSSKERTISLNAEAKGDASLTYKSSSKQITISADGKVTIPANYVGKSTITVTAHATSVYARTYKTITVTITPSDALLAKCKSYIKSLTPCKFWGEHAITFKWDDSSVAQGYHVQVSPNKSFKDERYDVWYEDYYDNEDTIFGLEKNHRYYFRVRGYMTCGGKYYYSDWSETKSCIASK